MKKYHIFNAGSNFTANSNFTAGSTFWLIPQVVGVIEQFGWQGNVFFHVAPTVGWRHYPSKICE